MRRTTGLALWLGAAGAALAQVPPAELGQRNVPAPWWMQQPVIASIGMVRTEVPANRASFSASFTAVGKTAEASRSAAGEQVRAIDAALAKLGASRVRVNTNFSTTPLYEQYRDKDGDLVDNERADKIERYSTTASLAVEVRDLAVLQATYNAVLAAAPTEVDQVSFELQPDNATKSWLQTEAVKDAANRAREAAAAAGARLGAPKVIDPTGRACHTDILAGWPSYGSGPRPTDVAAPERLLAAAAPAAEIIVTGAARKAGEPPAATATLQPPLRELTDQACVVYALLP